MRRTKTAYLRAKRHKETRRLARIVRRTENALCPQKPTLEPLLYDVYEMGKPGSNEITVYVS